MQILLCYTIVVYHAVDQHLLVVQYSYRSSYKKMGLSLDKVASLAATILKTDRRYVCVIQISIVTRVIDVMPEATYSPSSPGEPLEEEKTWFGTTFEYCEKMVEYAKNRDPTVKFMLEKIKEVSVFECYNSPSPIRSDGRHMHLCVCFLMFTTVP